MTTKPFPLNKLLKQKREIAGGKKSFGDADGSFAQDGKGSKAMVHDTGFAYQTSLMLAPASTSSLHPSLQHCQQNITFHYEKLMNLIINEDYGFTIIPQILDIVHHSTLKAHNISHASSASFKFHSLGARGEPMQAGHLERAILNPGIKTKHASHVQNFSHDYDCIPLFFIGQ
jgi:hypothetical protein